MARMPSLPFVRSLVNQVLPSLDSPRNTLRDTWDKLSKVPGGKKAYSKMIGLMAPYSATIGADVEELRRGYCRVSMRDHRGVRNHLQSVHAIALVNLAEIAGNVCLAYGMPDDARFIVAGLDITYVKKARGKITATCSFGPIATSERKEYVVPVSLRNPEGEEVATAKLRTLVGPKKN